MLFLYFFSAKTVNNGFSAGIKLTTAYLLGQGLLANFWLLLAIFGWFSPILIKILTALLACGGVILSFQDVVEFLKKTRQVIAATWADSWEWKAISSLTIFACFLWVTSLGRSQYGDGASFYLALAKVTAESHHLLLLPGYENLMSIGLQGEMHFAALMSLGSPGAARLFPWPILLAGILMLITLAKKVGIKLRGQWLAAAMIFTSSAMIELSGSGKTDLFAVALGFAAYYWAMEIQNEDSSRALWLTGLFSGLALIAKLSYIYTFIPSIFILSFWSYTKKDQKDGKSIFSATNLTMTACIILSAVALAALPHLVKNYSLFGNAFAPFGEATSGWLEQTWYGPITTQRILLTLPLALTFGDYWAQIGNLSPLILIFSPLMLLLPRPREMANHSLFIITLAAIVGVTCWFILRPSVLAPRYFMACLLLLVLPVAKAVEYINEQHMQLKVLSSTSLIITILILCTSMAFYTNKVFLPQKTVSYLEGNLNECKVEARFCGLATMINESAGPGDRIFINNLRYWLRSDLIQCTLTTEEINSYLQLETSEQRWSFIYGRGFKFIPIINNWNPVENRLREDLKDIPKWLAITKTTSNGSHLFQLNSLDASRQPVVQCIQSSPSIWNLTNN